MLVLVALAVYGSADAEEVADWLGLPVALVETLCPESAKCYRRAGVTARSPLARLGPHLAADRWPEGPASTRRSDVAAVAAPASDRTRMNVVHSV
jgi:hypothetical protein